MIYYCQVVVWISVHLGYVAGKQEWRENVWTSNSTAFSLAQSKLLDNFGL